MAILSQLSRDEFSTRLSVDGLPLKVGPYIYRVRSKLPTVEEGIRALYNDFEIATDGDFIDYDIALQQKGIRQHIHRQLEFLFDGTTPFNLIPLGQAYAFLEWGMNWCVSIHANEYLKLHAAAVARNDAAIIMPGIPGAGKSTLCAALGLSGWRVLSDEHALIEPASGHIVPLCRPVSLKNESIGVIKSFSHDACFGPVSEETHKGRVAHMKADLHSQSHQHQPLSTTALVFPRYSPDDPQGLSKRRRTDSFLLAAYHSFNYSLLGDTGFNVMKNLVDEVECFDLIYGDIDWAVDAMNTLVEGRHGA